MLRHSKSLLVSKSFYFFARFGFVLFLCCVVVLFWFFFLVFYHIGVKKSVFLLVFNTLMVPQTSFSQVVIATITEKEYLQDTQLCASQCLHSEGVCSPAPLFLVHASYVVIITVKLC